MADDILHRIRQGLQIYSYKPPDNHLKILLFQELDSTFSNNGLSLSAYNLMIPTNITSTPSTNRLIIEELSYDRAALQAEADHMYSILNEEQKQIFHTIITDIDKGRKTMYFVSGFGGTGKTFLWNCIIYKLRSQDGYHKEYYLKKRDRLYMIWGILPINDST
ncbi:uncharacterized protein LOC133891208 [Phragmites australis]|uniref:uncharacterized protein LOC133891208 n=1 Tax=Phragmites australis TaxID=29695 RepID=UPI002D78A0A2|nr:uncharacterized protein LOC133891208 [Phragmites australis]